MHGKLAACCLVMTICSAAAIAQPSIKRCNVATLEGEVRAGESFLSPIGTGLELMLEPLASGWIVRVLPAGKPRPSHDYAELATPPYRSVSPLLISTDYSFRAQDAIGWNPRRFHFAASDANFIRMLKAYEEYESKGPASVSAQTQLAELASQAPAATFTILDARLIPGTGDQARTVAPVASHFAATAHTIETPTDGKTSPLGKITAMRFRVELELPQGFRPDRRLSLKPVSCGR